MKLTAKIANILIIRISKKQDFCLTNAKETKGRESKSD